MPFDPSNHIQRISGKPYLPVSARLIWFREEHPTWGIVTTPFEINHEKQFAVFVAQIFNEEGKLMATAHKKEDIKGFPDYIEKSETGAVGRALAMCGYGTQFAPDFIEGTNRVVDGPLQTSQTARQPYNRPNTYGNTANRPAQPNGGQ